MIQCRRRDERGATFVITAVAMVMLLGAGAMGVDIGLIVDTNRQAQAMADTGALDMARYINLGDGVYSTQGVNSFNNYMAAELANVSAANPSSGATLSWTPGYWSSTTGWSAATGICYAQLRPNNPPCTAVKVTATQTVPRVFAGGSDSVSRSAIGYLNPEDGFSIGTYLANLNSNYSPVLNGMLGLLGTSVNLTAVGYEGLADTSLTVKQLIAASATVGSPLTPSTVMTTSLTAAAWLSIFKTAVANQELSLNCAATPTPSPCVAYTNLNALTFSGSASSSVELCQLVSINGSSCGSGDLSGGELSVGLDLLQTLETEAEVANNGTNTIDLGTSLFGLDAKLALKLIEPPALAYGPAGGTPPATSSQVQSTLELFVPGIGEMDVSLGAAEGTATLFSVTCAPSNDSLSQAVVKASTTAATGSVTLNDPTLGVDEPVATSSVSGVSNASLAFIAPIPPTTSEFGPVTTTNPNPNPAQIGATAPTVSITTLGGLGAAVNTLLATPPVSTLIGQVQTTLSGILQAAGITVAGADVADTAIDCDSVSLVQ